MSLETKSMIRNRVYKRAFDHDDAIARHAAGERVGTLAREYGVSPMAVKRVVNPEVRARMDMATKKWVMQGVCIDCGKKGIARARTRCQACAALARATSVRETTLRCQRCREWFPDEEFLYAAGRHPSRRGRRPHCRKCSTIIRQEYREKSKVPCSNGCGRMVEGKGRAKKANPNRPYLCRFCYNTLHPSPGNTLQRLYSLPLLGENE